MSVHLKLLLAVIIWGWTFVATKIALVELTPVELLALRLAIGLPILLLFLKLKSVPLKIERSQILSLAVGSLVITAHFLIQITGLKYTSATNTGWIISITPLVIALLSYIFLKETITRFAVLGIGVATAGILLLVSGGNFENLGWIRSVGDWLVLASAHTWAIYTVVTRPAAREMNPLLVTTIVFLIPTLVLSIYVASSSSLAHFTDISSQTTLAILFLAILGTALAQWFWQEGVRHVGASRAGYYLYLEPIATVLLAVPLLGEPFGIISALGGGLVLAGVWLAQGTKS